MGPIWGGAGQPGAVVFGQFNIGPSTSEDVEGTRRGLNDLADDAIGPFLSKLESWSRDLGIKKFFGRGVGPAGPIVGPILGQEAGEGEERELWRMFEQNKLRRAEAADKFAAALSAASAVLHAQANTVNQPVHLADP